MTEVSRTLDRLYIASPCSANWDAMPGTEQVRFCGQCQLNVYNISAMTRVQAEELFAKTEGRLCTKFYRRADGTVITQDCPVGLRAVKRRASHLARVALGMVLSLFTSQTPVWANDHESCKLYTAKTTRLESQDGVALMVGTVADENGSVIAKAKVIIVNEATRHESSAQTNDEGQYRFASLQEGVYSIAIESPGFRTFRKKNLKVKGGEALQFDVTMQVGTLGGAAFLPEGKKTTLSERS